jgi:mannose-1-phosphate guanylyltransferase
MRAGLGDRGGVRMSTDAASSPLAPVEAVPPLPFPPRLWGIVLAGGEGVRLRALTRQMCGDERPKQYLPLLGDRTLLRETLDRVALAIPPARTAVVTLRHHAGYVAAETRGDGRPHVLLQPQDRGTAAGILLPAQWILQRQPDATVAVFPSDHFVLEEAAFMTHVARIAGWLDEHPDQIVLLGAQATEAEVEYGWIELGKPLSAAPDPRIWRVRRFWEKPSADTARLCLQAGCLWNTLVLLGKAATFVRAGSEALPAVHDRLARLEPFLGTEEEPWALHQAYALMPKADFSRSVLEPCPPFLAVSEMPGVTWSDLGSPRRVQDVVRRALRGVPWWLGTDLKAS